MSVTVLVSGAFDPIHEGHLSLLKEAKRIGRLVVAVNSDEYVRRKKGACLLPRAVRAEVLKNLKVVDEVLVSWKECNSTAIEAIQLLNNKISPGDILIVANGGDVTPTKSNLEEWQFCARLGIPVLFGVGGNKKNSSSNLLKDYISNQS